MLYHFVALNKFCNLCWFYDHSRKSMKLHPLSPKTSTNPFPSKKSQYASPCLPMPTQHYSPKTSPTPFRKEHLSRPISPVVFPENSPMFHCLSPGFPFWYPPYGGTCETCGGSRELGLSERWAGTTRALGSSFCPFFFFMALPRAKRRHILSFERGLSLGRT